MPTREQKLEYKRRYRLKNKEKIVKYNNEYKERRKEIDRLRTLKERGLSIDQYNILFKQQEGKCAICGTHQDKLKQSLCVDHNHKTNQIRGLLCGKCNRGIGYLNDDVNVLEKAIQYLINKS